MKDVIELWEFWVGAGAAFGIAYALIAGAVYAVFRRAAESSKRRCRFFNGDISRCCPRHPILTFLSRAGAIVWPVALVAKFLADLFWAGTQFVSRRYDTKREPRPSKVIAFFKKYGFGLAFVSGACLFASLIVYGCVRFERRQSQELRAKHEATKFGGVVDRVHSVEVRDRGMFKAIVQLKNGTQVSWWSDVLPAPGSRIRICAHGDGHIVEGGSDVSLQSEGPKDY